MTQPGDADDDALMTQPGDADDDALMTQPGDADDDADNDGDALMTHTVTQSGDVPAGSGAYDARVR